MSPSRRLSASLVLALATSGLVISPASATPASDTVAAWESDRDAARVALDSATRDASAAQSELEAAEAALSNAQSAAAAAERRQREAEGAVDRQTRDNKADFDAEIARLRDDVERARTAAAQATSAEAEAKTAWENASAATRQAAADRDAVQAELNRTAETVQKYDKALASKNAEREHLIEERDYWANNRFNQAEYERVTAQAIVEMVNDYRRANGLAPLRTHASYNQQAGNWTRNMAANGFRHSPDAWGRSGENIALSGYYTPSTMTAEQWGKLAEQFFTQWRTSTEGHNQSMLDSQYQGIGVGIAFDSKGVAYSTTMFFIEDTKLADGRFYQTDGMTRTALNSGQPFYRAAGAKQLIGLGNWSAPNNPGNATVNNAKILGGRQAQAQKMQGLTARVDEKVDMSKRANPTKAAEINARVQAATREYNQMVDPRNAAAQRKTVLEQQRKAQQARVDAAAGAERDRQHQYDAAKTQRANAASALDRAQKAQANAPTGPTPVPANLLDERQAARGDAEVKGVAVAQAQRAVDEKKAAADAARAKQSEAQSAYDGVLVAAPSPAGQDQPYNPTFNTHQSHAATAGTQVSTQGSDPDGESSDGSSVENILGIVVVILGIIGLVAGLLVEGNPQLQLLFTGQL